MFLIKTALWSILYPTLVFVYACHTIIMWIKFLFNSPVDVWMIINETVENDFKNQ